MPNSSSSQSNTSKYSKNALLAYKSAYNHRLGFSNINTFLRLYNISDGGIELNKYNNDTTTRRVCRIIKSIDKQLLESTKTITLFRGMSKKYYNVVKETGVLVNKAFLSTASTLESAIDYGDGGVIIQFELPKNIKSYTYPVEQNDEHEVLVERNTQFINFSEPVKKDTYILVSAILVKYNTPSTKEVTKPLSPTQVDAKDKIIKQVLRLTKTESDENSDFD